VGVASNTAAWAVAVHGGAVFSCGVVGEDREPYRAEVEGILAVLEAADRSHWTGRLIVIADCSAAIDATAGKGHARLLVLDVQSRWGRLCRRGFEVSIHWVPRQDFICSRL